MRVVGTEGFLSTLPGTAAPLDMGNEDQDLGLIQTPRHAVQHPQSSPGGQRARPGTVFRWHDHSQDSRKDRKEA